MQRNHKEFTDMFNAIHHSGTVTVFDTNYRSYVMEHCYPQQNNRRAIEVMADIIPNTDVLVAGSEDIFALEPEKERSIERAKDEFFNLVPLSSLCVLKAGKDGAYWRDGSGSWHHIPANPVNVRSTTGAGDAFNAGLLLAMRNGKNFKDAMTFAGVVASKIVASNTSLLTIHEASDLVFVF